VSSAVQRRTDCVAYVRRCSDTAENRVIRFRSTSSVFADRVPHATGCAILLTNDPSYWTQSLKENTADMKFRLHEGSILHGSLGWGPGASEGTRRGREELLQLGGSHPLRWEDYSHPAEGSYGAFPYLVVEVKDGASTLAANSSVPGTH
jgi:hypothetical protein